MGFTLRCIKTFLPEEYFKVYTSSGDDLLVSKPSIHQRFYSNYDVINFYNNLYIKKESLETDFTFLKNSRSFGMDHKNTLQISNFYKHKKEDKLISVFDPQKDEDPNNYLVSYIGFKQETSKEVIEDLINSLKEKQSLRKVFIIVYENNQFRVKATDLKKDIFLLEGFYNKDFNEVYDHIITSLKNEDKGLYLFHGTPGTGKTTFIKHLTEKVSEKKNSYLFLIVS